MKNYLRLFLLLIKQAPLQTGTKLLQITASAVAMPLTMYAIQRIVDALPASGGAVDLSIVALWGGLLLLALFFTSVGDGLLNNVLNISLKRKMMAVLTPRILEKFASLDYSVFERAELHDTIKRMSGDPQEKLLALFLNICDVVKSFVALIGASLIFASAGWWYVALFFLLFVPSVFLDFKTEDVLEQLYDEQSPDERRLDSLKELLSEKKSLYELRIFGAGGYILNKWKILAGIVLDKRLKTNLHAQKYALVSLALLQGWALFLIISLSLRLSGGMVTLGLFTTLIASSDALLETSSALSWLARDLRQNSTLLNHFFRFLKFPDAQYGAVSQIGKIETIEFEHVSFSYPGSPKPALIDVSFKINAGERIALVGYNGAGKSTVVKLLCGLYCPDAGRVLINGLDLRSLSRQALQGLFSAVFQDFCGYELTVRENVSFGDISKIGCDEHLLSALNAAGADLRDLDAHLGKLEDGTDLSGGEWQRIAIARALVSDRDFLLLDEPTASLDPIAESRLYHQFLDIMGGRSCILISHRLAATAAVDRILVLNQGIIAESGSHAELMNRGGQYREMFALQSSWYNEVTK